VARPTKYTPELVERICDALRKGTTRANAGTYAGIDHATFCRYLHRHCEFREAVEKAEADAQLGHEAIIRKAATDGTWTASAWWLERRRHADYGRKLDIGGQQGNPVQLAVVWPGITDEGSDANDE
jgi:hypothetical protein